MQNCSVTFRENDLAQEGRNILGKHIANSKECQNRKFENLQKITFLGILLTSLVFVFCDNQANTCEKHL